MTGLNNDGLGRARSFGSVLARSASVTADVSAGLVETDEERLTGEVLATYLDGTGSHRTETFSGTDAVSSAFDALPSDGGTVIVGQGTFIESGGYDITKPHELIGVGSAAASEIKLADGANTYLFQFDMDSTDPDGPFCVWDSIKLNGNKGNQTGGSYLIRTNTSNKLRDFKMREVWVDNAYNWGMQIRGHNVHVDNCAFEHCSGVGLQLPEIEDAVIENSRILNNSTTDPGIQVQPLNTAPGSNKGYPVIRSNFINGADIGIKIAGGTATTRDNTINDVNTGILVDSTSAECRLDPLDISGVTGSRVDDSGTRTKYGGVIGGGPLGGIDLSAVNGLHDGDEALSDGTATGFPAYTRATWDGANSQWVRVDGQATV